MDTKQDTTFVQGFPVNFGLDNQIMVDHFGTSGELAMYYNKEYHDIFKSKIDNSREHLHISSTLGSIYIFLLNESPKLELPRSRK